MNDDVASTPLGQREIDQREIDQREAPLLRVVRGEPTPEELAALVAVIASLGQPSGGLGDASARRTPVWNAPSRLTRVTHRHGDGGWRASGLPR